MNVADMVSTTRRSAGLFDMTHRGLLEVRGGDRVRWLDGMISRDVEALEKAESGAGCYAVLLTNRGAIVADLHVARLGDVFLLETLRSEVANVRRTLERFIIADDVELLDRSDDFVAIGLEGPCARELMGKLAGSEVTELDKEAWVETEIAGIEVLVAAFGYTGEVAFQIRMKPEDRRVVEEALVAAANPGEAVAGNGDSIVRADFEALEILRVEAGIPMLGRELDEEVLPPEAQLGRAISTDKGCYVGQEIVARLRARGQVNHLLVGFRLDSSELPAIDSRLSSGGRATGEFTSIALSPTEGPIALGYVRREHSESGTRVEFEGGHATVVSLPFVSGGARQGLDDVGEGRASDPS